MRLRLKPFLPRSLQGRAALILIVPIVAIQFIVSVAFIQRHYDGVTRQMTRATLVDVQFVLEAASQDSQAAQRVAERLQMVFHQPPAQPLPQAQRIGFLDFSGRAMADVLQGGLAGLQGIDLTTDDKVVRIWVQSPAGLADMVFARGRVSASNPHQLLAVMITASVLMTALAWVFLRNQMVPIARLARVSEAFGRGETLPYRPRGAAEVRAAGHAFLAMRARIERQIESRTLMLSGVSHDLRTPITRLKLGLSFLPEDAETAALQQDVADMERLVEEFLAFARGDAMEEAALADPGAVAAALVERAVRGGLAVDYQPQSTGLVRMRPVAVARAVGNLISNAGRHGRQVRLSLRETAGALAFVVEDDGPGIAPDMRDRAIEPFQRLDAARNPNQGGGVGLGLSIAADVARSHGGSLRLGVSEALGGLKAELILPK